MRDEAKDEVYLPLTSTVILKRKQEMFYAPLDFENNLTLDALVDSRAFVSAVTQNNLGRNKRGSPELDSQNRQSSNFSATSSK